MSFLPDKNGIINSFVGDVSGVNDGGSLKFNAFAFIYDIVQGYFFRSRLHNADPKLHQEILAELIAPVKESKILDIACGTGGAIAYFNKSNDYTGLDISYGMLKRAVKKADKKAFNACRFIHGNAEQLICEDKSFDFVLMDTALHIISNYQAAIAEIKRVLVNDGVFVCSTPAVGINRKFDATWAKMSAKHPLHSLAVADIENACTQAGLQFHQCDTNGGMLYFQADKTDQEL